MFNAEYFPHFHKSQLKMVCAKFCWKWPSGSWEDVDNVKSLHTDRQTDGRQIKCDHNSSLELRDKIYKFYDPSLFYYMDSWDHPSSVVNATKE